MKYVIVTPARDEAINIESTIRSVLAQTDPPQEWVIVNDGSSDRTAEIVDSYAAQTPWIRPVHRTDRGRRKSGAGVMEAFQDGYRALRTSEWDFIVKLDADLSFDPDYFERCFDRFLCDTRLGIGGGTICHVVDGIRIVREDRPTHVRGATKIYRRACWNAIGGLVCMTGWDTIDEMKANMLGWRTFTFRDLLLVEHRFTGAADGSWKNAIKNGRANYITGYHPVFMVLKCAKRMFSAPPVIDAAGLLWGYFGSCIKRLPRVPDPELIAYIRQQQIRRLLFKPSLYRQR
jgi:glycosyltransferase involved in cell wall biosynthesis